MKIDLDKQALISLAKGTTPNYSAMGDQIVKNNGQFKASYGRWDWNWDAFHNCTEEEIYNTYLLCKNSWITRKDDFD